ncbi:DUF397 domain-containing protein [Actinomadura sp. NPDC049382]|uniref:DUF397 domain-containing protein n=1 Tax=Actinomadura sp. NPDC049382 TaxID=3158220 RepID=UPI0034438AB9
MITWRKAGKSDGQGGACVEVARFPEAVAVRDSKDPDGPKLLLTPRTFQTILNSLKQ